MTTVQITVTSPESDVTVTVDSEDRVLMNGKQLGREVWEVLDEAVRRVRGAYGYAYVGPIPAPDDRG